jgi:hypothetical protein
LLAQHTVSWLSPRLVAELRATEGWKDEDVVLEGTDPTGQTMTLSRRDAAVSHVMVRGWLRVRDRNGHARMHVVRTFSSVDGALFSPCAGDT